MSEWKLSALAFAWNNFIDSFFLTDYPYDWLLHWLWKQPSWSRNSSSPRTPSESDLNDATTGERSSRDNKCLIVGCGMPNSRSPLPGACSDARRFGKKLEALGVLKENLVVLTDDDASEDIPTRGRVLEEFEQIVDSSGHNTWVIFYWAGHGCRDKTTGHGYLPCTPEPDYPGSYDKITQEDINEHLLDRLPATAIVTVITDCCYSGGIFKLGTRWSRHGMRNREQNPEIEEPKCAVLFLGASGIDELSWESPRYGGGVFTDILIKAWAVLMSGIPLHEWFSTLRHGYRGFWRAVDHPPEESTIQIAFSKAFGRLLLVQPKLFRLR